MTVTTETEKLAGYVAGLRYEDIPTDVVNLAKNCLLDILGCALAGGKEEHASRVANGAADCHAGVEATAWAISRKTSVAGAAMAGAVCAEAADFAYAVGGNTMIPAALAIAEKERLTGRQVIVALVAGHEVLWRIHKAVNQFALQERGFYPQGVCAIFGPSATSSKLLDLDAQATANALCLAAGAGIGIRAYSPEGQRTKLFYLGTAAATGATIGYLARAGMSAARLSVEGDKLGFFKVYAGTHYDPTELSYKLGAEFLMRRIAFKLYPACRYVHTSVDAARELAPQVHLKDIQRIEVRVPTLAAQAAGERPIRSSYDCQFSIPWVVAVTLIDGTGLTVLQISAKRMQDQQVLALAAKVRVLADPELDACLEGDGLPPFVISCRMKIIYRNGTEQSASVDFARGSAENPPSDTELRTKFQHQVKGVIDSVQLKTIESLVDDFEHLKDISPLISAIARRGDLQNDRKQA